MARHRLRNEQGQYNPGPDLDTPPQCLDCEVELVVQKRNAGKRPTNEHKGRGRCRTCYDRRARAGAWDGPPPPLRLWKTEELMAEFEQRRSPRHRSMAEAIRAVAEEIGVSFHRLEGAVYRARRYRERDAQRASELSDA